MSFWTEALGAEVKYYDAGGVRTRVIEAGRGEPVIMMHGLSGHAESFIRNIMPLANAGFRAISMDAIGHGFTDKPTNVTYHSPTFVKHLADFMDAIGAPKAHLVGQSLGGWTAMDFALAHPSRVLSIVSLTGAGILLEDAAAKKESEGVHKTVQQVTQNAIQAPTLESVRKRIEWLMYDKANATDELVETRYRIICLPDAKLAMPKLVAEQPGEGNRVHMITEAKLRAIKARTLIVWTDHNPTTPVPVAQRAAGIIPNARFHLVTGAGHWPMYERADDVNPLLVGFLKGG